MKKAPHSKQIRWKCRRGMLELDYLLFCFFDQHYSALPPAFQKKFSDLLAASDVELYQWLIQKQTPELPEFKEMVTFILSKIKNSQEERNA